MLISLSFWTCNQPYSDEATDSDFNRLSSYDNGQITDIVYFGASRLGYIDSNKKLKIFDTEELAILDPFLFDDKTELNDAIISPNIDGSKALFTIDRYNNIWARKYSDALDDGWLGDAVKCSNSDIVHGDNSYPVRFTVNDDWTKIFILFDHPESSSTSIYDDSYILGKRTLYSGTLLLDDDGGIFEVESCDLLSELYYPSAGDSTFLSFEKDASNLYYDRGMLYILDPANSQIIVIESPDNIPALSQAINIEGPKKMVFDGERIYVAKDGYKGVSVLGRDDHSSLGSFAEGFTVKDIFIDDESNYIVLSCGYHGVLIYRIDIDNYIEKVAVATSFAYSSVLDNNILYVATKNGIEKIDLTEELQ